MRFPINTTWMLLCTGAISETASITSRHPFQSRIPTCAMRKRSSGIPFSAAVGASGNCSTFSSPRIWAETGIDLALRDHTPPPSEISEVS